MYLEEKYVNLFTNFGFRRIFGSEVNKLLLIDFLNTLLPAHHQVQSLSYESSEYLGSTLGDRTTLDVYGQGKNGDYLIIELQMAKHNFFGSLVAFYNSFPIQEKVRFGEWNCKSKSIYSIGVLDFVFSEHYTDREIIYNENLKIQNCNASCNELQVIYIELPRFKKNLGQIASHFDKWLYLFKHLPDTQNQPSSFAEDVFLQLFEAAELANLSAAEQDSYENSLKYYRDMNNVINTAREEGAASRLEQWRKQGKAERSVEIARALLGKLPVGTISETTGLSIEEIEQLS
ncbi:MAG: Rpn family recombination-promoting nuclease/putative transposase [Cyanobacteria bacterium P01_D01_bin.105]